MSQYETDREEIAVGPELCDECNHPVRLHADQYGCEFERGDAWVDGEAMGAWEAQGPCGCMQHGETRVTFAAGQRRLGRALEAVAELLGPHLNSEKLVLGKHLTTDSEYVCSKEQARKILRKATKTYRQDTELAGDDSHGDMQTFKIYFNKDGSIKIGCMEFSKSQVSKIRRWLRSKKRAPR